jgi:hypothetical protein
MKSWRRFWDVLAELFVAVALVTGGIVYVMNHPKASMNWSLIAFAVNTAVVLGFLVAWFRTDWRESLFWRTLTALVVCHAAVYVLAIRHFSDIPLPYYALLVPIELSFITPILRNMIAKNRADLRRD